MSGFDTVARQIRSRKSQEGVIFLLTAVLFVIFSVSFKGFLGWENISNLLLNVSLLGVLALGMSFVVIGRGIDLSIVTVALCSSALTLQLLNDGFSLPIAVGGGLALAVAAGLVNGVLVAFFEITPFFATLASSPFFFGVTVVFLVRGKITYVPASETAILYIAQGRLIGVPVPIVVFAALAAIAAITLKTLTYGRYFYAMGDNIGAAYVSGLPVRPLIVVSYVVCSLFAFIGGMLIASASASISFQLAGSPFAYSVVMVIVLGGISLVGGRGGVMSVIAGTALIGTLLDGLVVINLNNDVQDIVKGFVLIFAILLDRLLHPVDEETAKQGDAI